MQSKLSRAFAGDINAGGNFPGVLADILGKSQQWDFSSGTKVLYRI
jgi:hypothetical protein